MFRWGAPAQAPSLGAASVQTQSLRKPNKQWLFGWKCHLSSLAPLYPKSLECLVGGFTPAPWHLFWNVGWKIPFQTSLTWELPYSKLHLLESPANGDPSQRGSRPVPQAIWTATQKMNMQSPRFTLRCVFLGGCPGARAFTKPGLLLIQSHLDRFVSRKSLTFRGPTGGAVFSHWPRAVCWKTLFSAHALYQAKISFIWVSSSFPSTCQAPDPTTSRKAVLAEVGLCRTETSAHTILIPLCFRLKSLITVDTLWLALNPETWHRLVKMDTCIWSHFLKCPWAVFY